MSEFVSFHDDDDDDSLPSLSYTNNIDVENIDIRLRLYEALEKISSVLMQEYPTDSNEDWIQSYEERRQELVKKIQKFFVDMFKTIPPVIVIENRTWGNCFYGDRLRMKPSHSTRKTIVKFSDRRSIKKFSLISFVLGKIHKLLSLRVSVSKRELYYQNVDKFTSQHVLDRTLNDVSSLLNCSLHEMNINPCSTGLVYGPLQIVTPSCQINCLNPGGTLIPHDISRILGLRSTAKFILVIEKDAIFQKLLDDGMPDYFDRCIFITGKGFPDVNTRALIKHLWDKLTIPIYALVDPDPSGIEIMCVYRFGSLSLMHQVDKLAVPSIRWLGILPSDIEKWYDRTEVLTARDKSKLMSILGRPYVQENLLIKNEVQILIEKNYKAETEGIERTVSNFYLRSVYLPAQIIQGNAI